MSEEEYFRSILDRLWHLVERERWGEVLDYTADLRSGGISGTPIDEAEATAALQLEDYARAEPLIRRLRSSAEEEHLEEMWYQVLWATDREAEVVALAERNLGRFPGSGLHAKQLAHAAFRAHDLARARYYLNVALDIAPADAHLRQMRLLLAQVGQGVGDEVVDTLTAEEQDVAETLARLVRAGDGPGFARAYRRYAPECLLLENIAERIIARATLPPYRLLDRAVTWIKVEGVDHGAEGMDRLQLYGIIASGAMLLLWIGVRNDRFEPPALQLLHLVVAVVFLPAAAAGCRFSVAACGRYGAALHEKVVRRIGYCNAVAFVVALAFGAYGLAIDPALLSLFWLTYGIAAALPYVAKGVADRKWWLPVIFCAIICGTGAAIALGASASALLAAYALMAFRVLVVLVGAATIAKHVAAARQAQQS